VKARERLRMAAWLAAVGGIVASALMASNDVEVSSFRRDPQGLEIRLSGSEAAGERWEIFSLANTNPGVAPSWSIESSGLTIPIEGWTSWWDSAASGSPVVKFYVAGHADVDADGDEVSDAREHLVYKTAPDRRDSDDDGMPDGWEIQQGHDPRGEDSARDPDADGFASLFEYLSRCDPHSATSLPRDAVVTVWAGTNCQAVIPDLTPTGMPASMTFTQIPPAGSVADVGEVMVLVGTPSGNGQWIRRPYLVIVAETNPPTMTPPEDLVIQRIEDIPVPDPASVAWDDECSVAVVEHFGDQYGAGTGCAEDPIRVARVYRAWDDFGNEAFCTQQILIADAMTLAVSPLPDMELAIGASLDPTNTGYPLAWANCCTDFHAYHTDTASGECVQVITRVWTATNSCGGMGTITQRIISADRTAPSFSSLPSSLVIGCRDAIPGAPALMAFDDQPQRASTDGLWLDLPLSVIADQTTPDVSTNGHVVQVEGALVDSGGRAGNAFIFDGVDDLLRLPGATSRLDGFTVSMWVRTPGTGTERRRLLTRYGPGYEWWISLELERLQFGMSPGGVLMGGGPSINDSAWHHLAMVHDVQRREDIGYVDGVAVFAQPAMPWMPPPSMDPDKGIVIGASDHGDQAFPGWMDNVRLFSRPLTVGEISAVMQDVPLGHVVDIQLDTQDYFTSVCSTIVRTWTAQDRCGNVASVTQTVTIVDDVPPSLLGVPGDLFLHAPALLPTAGVVTVTDDCSATLAAQFRERFVGSATAEVRRVWTAVDSCGNTAAATQRLFISEADVDADGLADVWERQWALVSTTDSWQAESDVLPWDDIDLDGLTNSEEYEHGTSPLHADTDLDWISDGREVAAGTDPVDTEEVPDVGVIINEGKRVLGVSSVEIVAPEGFVADTMSLGERPVASDGDAVPFARHATYLFADGSNGSRHLVVRYSRVRDGGDYFAEASLQYDDAPPQLTIESPLHGQVVSGRWVRVEGKVRDGGGEPVVTVDGRYATGVLEDRFWHSRVPLTQGTNAIEVTAADPAGHTVTQVVHVVLDATGDTNPPSLYLNLPAGCIASDDATNPVVPAQFGGSPVLYFDGVCDDATALLVCRVSSGSGVTNGPYPLTLDGTNVYGEIPLFDSTNILCMTAEDAAGNAATVLCVIVRNSDLVFEITDPAPYEVVSGTGVIARGVASIALRDALISVNGIEADIQDMGDHMEFVTRSAVPLGTEMKALRGRAEIDGRVYHCDPLAVPFAITLWQQRFVQDRSFTRDRCGDYWTESSVTVQTDTWEAPQMVRTIRGYADSSWEVTPSTRYEWRTEFEPVVLEQERPLAQLVFGETRALNPLIPFKDPSLCTLIAGSHAFLRYDGTIAIKTQGTESSQQKALIEFVGMWYETLGGTSEAHRIFFRGIPGIAETSGVSFVVPYYPGETITISGRDFAWPEAELGSQYSHCLTFSDIRIRPLRKGAVADLNHDGVIDRKDELLGMPTIPVSGNLVTDPQASPPEDTNYVLRLWINDDADDGEIAVGLSDTPGARTGLLEFDGLDPNYDDVRVNGYSDLVDFFPIYLDLAPYLDSLPPHATYTLRHEEEAVNVVFSALRPENAGSFQTVMYTNGFGDELAERPQEARTVKLTAEGVRVPQAFLDNIRTNGGGVILVEGRPPATGTSISMAPILVDIRVNHAMVSTVELPIQLTPVEEFYEWLNLRPVAGQEAERPTDLRPDNFPQYLWNGKFFAFIHGYNVHEDDARGFCAETFKRLWQSGSRAMFVGVTWHGDQGQIPLWTPGDFKWNLSDPFDWQPHIVNVDPDYYGNVTNAFLTAQVLPAFLAAITERRPVILAAHSLGNILASSAIVDHGLNVEKYFMINAAAPVEAYDAGELKRLQMTNPAWYKFMDRVADGSSSEVCRLSSAEWHDLFGTSDRRRSLTWRGRFDGLTNAINFYSSSEDVLAPNGEGGMPSIGRDRVWVHQEMVKGSVEASLAAIRLSQGGWGFNFHGYWETDPEYHEWDPPPPSVWSAISNDELRQNPFFRDFKGAEDLYRDDSEVANYMKRSVWLSEAIPALSFAAGGSEITAFDLNSIDMPELSRDKSWPQRLNQRWGHSDFKMVSYFYTSDLYLRMIQEGRL
jgi:hypothetical protein